MSNVQVMDDFLEFSMLLYSKKRDCLYWRLKQLYHKKEKLKLKSRIKLNHNTFKVITELLKPGTSVKKMENKANTYVHFKA